MKTKTIPFDLETAKKIQAGEIEGAIKTRDGKHEVKIVCYDSTAKYFGKTQPIIAQDIDDCCYINAYFENGYFTIGEGNNDDLVLEVPDSEQQFKPFDKVLVRDYNDDRWFPALYAFYDGVHYMVAGSGTWAQCIPYEGNEHLVGTTDKPKED